MHKTHVPSFLKVFILLFSIPLAFATIGTTLPIHAAVVDSIDGGGTVPAAPTLYTPSATQTSVSLSWSSVSGATGYKIYKNGLYLTSTASTSYTNSGLTCWTSYSYYIKAYNSYGTSAASNTVSTSTSVCNDPVLTVGTVTTTSAHLSWTYAGTVTGQEIVQFTMPCSDPLQPCGTTVATLGTSERDYTLTGLTCGTNYSVNPFSVIVYIPQTKEGFLESNDVSFTTQACPIPSAPTNASLSNVGQTSMTLSWTDNSSNEDGFKIYRNTLITKSDSIIPRANAADQVLIATVGANVTSYNITGLTCNTMYSYSVEAYNTGGSSSQSSASATTDPCTPAAPSNVNLVTTGDTSLTLSWTDNSNNETGFYIYRWTGSTWSYVTATAANITSYNILGLTCGTTYTYGVRAYNAGGSSGIISDSGTTYPCVVAPTLSSSLSSPTQISFSWTNVSNEIGYGLYRSDGTALDTNIPADTTTYALSWPYCGSSSFYVKAAYQHGTVVWSGPSNTVSETITDPSVCDTSPPTISFNPTSRSWDNTNIVVTVTASDAMSSVSYVRHCWTTSTSCDPGTTASNTFTNGGSVTQSSDGVWNLCVRARDSAGNWSSSSCAGTYQVDKTAPTPNPPSVSISAVSRTGATVSVSSGSDALVGLSTTPYGVSTNGSTYSWSSSTSQTLSGLTCETNYTVYGKIRDSLGNETSAGTAALKTLACDTTGPTISFSPTSRSWSSSNASVTVTASDESGVASTKYCWTTGTSCTPSTSFTNGTAVTQSSTGNWKLFITATDTLGNATTSSSQYYQVDKTAPTPNPPSVSTSNTSQTGTTITVALGSDSDAGLSATAYGVSTNGSTYSWSSSTSQSVSGLSCGTSYTAYGKIRDSVGNETSTGTSPFTTVVCTPPAPTGLSATAVSQTQINLSWNASSGATGYEIYRGGVYLTSVTGTTYSNTTGLNCGTTYSYTVRAYNAGGTSGDSVADSATTFNCISAPIVPQNTLVFQIQPGTTNYTATWQDVSADGYVLYKIDDADGSVEVLGDLTSLSNTGTLPSRCPADYTIGFYAYNADPTVSSIDPTCQSIESGVDSKFKQGRKCSEVRTTNVDIRHCTQGFLVD